jgi:hypothetical protein
MTFLMPSPISGAVPSFITTVHVIPAVLRAAFPDFHADIHWQLADDRRVLNDMTREKPFFERYGGRVGLVAVLAGAFPSAGLSKTHARNPRTPAPAAIIVLLHTIHSQIRV